MSPHLRLRHTIRRWLGLDPRSSRKQPLRKRCLLAVDRLEERAVPADLTVGLGGYSTIQEAIAAANPGDIINVAPGTYTGNILINKPITLQGAQADVDARDGRPGAQESVLSLGTYGLQPAADNITVNGFTIKNSGSGNGLLETYSNANAFTLENTIVQDTAQAVTGGAILFGGGSHTSMVFSQNLFLDQGDASLYFGGAEPSDMYDNLQITDNKFLGNSGGVFWAANPLVNGVIQGNEFDGTVNGVSGVGDPILNIGQSYNLTIANNYFHDENYTAFQVGMIGGSITGNTFTRIAAYAPLGFGDAFQLWGGQYGTAVSTNVTIANNIINFNDISGATYPTRGLRLRPPEGGSGIDGTTIHIYDNAFVNGGALPAGTPNLYAIVNQGDPTKSVDAAGNWWSTTSTAAIASLMSGPVDFTPFLISGTDTDPATPGFQGGGTVQIVTDPGNPDGRALVITGTIGDAHIQVKPVDHTNLVQVHMDTKGFTLDQTFDSTTFGRIIIVGQAGNDNIQVDNKIAIPTIILGGAGNNDIRAGGGPTVVVGGSGSDHIVGGPGNNILIGGGGGDNIEAHGGNDILIGGTTDYDTNLVALAALEDTWQGTTNANYASQVALMQTGPYTLDGTTVHDDGVNDHLNGGPSLDWFFVGTKDKVDGFDKKKEIATPIS